MLPEKIAQNKPVQTPKAVCIKVQSEKNKAVNYTVPIGATITTVGGKYEVKSDGIYQNGKRQEALTASVLDLVGFRTADADGNGSIDIADSKKLSADQSKGEKEAYKKYEKGEIKNSELRKIISNNGYTSKKIDEELNGEYKSNVSWDDMKVNFGIAFSNKAGKTKHFQIQEPRTTTNPFYE